MYFLVDGFLSKHAGEGAAGGRAQTSSAVALTCALMLGLACVPASAQDQGLLQAPLQTQAQAPSKSKVPVKPAKPGSSERHLLWSDLVPEGWDPMVDFRKRFSDPKLTMMDDADPKVMEMMRQMREIWDKAPVNAKMDGVSGKLPGYVVPLDDNRKGMKSFLLVPYYGACIHSPPPPANQIVLVQSSKPITGFHSMDTVWVHGTLQAFRGDSAMGVSGWRIDAVKVERYERPPVETAQ